MAMRCKRATVYLGPISTALYLKMRAGVTLLHLTERVQDISKTPVAYIAQILSSVLAIGWAVCLIARPEMLSTSVYMHALEMYVGRPLLIFLMGGLGFYQAGSVLFGPSQSEMLAAVEQGKYPGMRFIATALGLWAACSVWGLLGFLTYQGGGLNPGIFVYVPLSFLQVFAAFQIGYGINVTREGLRLRREDEKIAAAAKVLSSSPSPSPYPVSASTSTVSSTLPPLPMSR